MNVSARGFVSSSIANSATPCGRTTQVPAWEHVVWVVLENHGPSVRGCGSAYLTSLARDLQQCDEHVGANASLVAELHRIDVGQPPGNFR